MNLPWDKSYFKLCFYIIFTFMVIYIFKNTIDIIVYGLMNMGGIYRSVLKGIAAIISIFSVLIIGFVIAYVLNPVVDFLIKLKFKRGLAVLSAFIMLILIVSVVFIAIALNITKFGKYTLNEGFNIQIDIFNNNIVKIQNFLSQHNINILENIKPKITNDTAVHLTAKYFTQGFLGIIISIYFLKDKYKIISRLKIYYRLLPYKFTKYITYIMTNLNIAFSGYIRGQLADAFIMAALYSFALSVIGIPFSIPIGILSGLLNIIPYFGAILGIVITVGITALNGDFMGSLYAGIAIFVLQQIDGVWISPKIMGESVRLSPVAVIIALAVSSNVFGVFGMVLAVPIVSFLRVILNDYLKKKNIQE